MSKKGKNKNPHLRDNDKGPRTMSMRTEKRTTKKNELMFNFPNSRVSFL